MRKTSFRGLTQFEAHLMTETIPGRLWQSQSCRNSIGCTNTDKLSLCFKFTQSEEKYSVLQKMSKLKCLFCELITFENES